MDIYSEVTERIINQMEQGIIPWEQPWVGNAKTVSHATGKSYSILNQILLGKPGEYATFNQIKKEGGRVKKGAKGKMVVFWKMLVKEDDDGNKQTIPYLRYSCVFDLNDCEGIEKKYVVADKTFDNKPIEKAQAVLDGYISREGITLEHDNDGGAYYRPALDMIHLPAFDHFVGASEYYDTAFHECVHSTGHKSRLNRSGVVGATMFGSMDYSKEELIAEIGSCALIHTLGIETKNTFRNNAAYIQNWLKALKNDKRMLVGASSAASKAVDYILGIEQEGGEE